MVDVSNSNSDNKKTPDSDSSINSEAQFKELTATAKDWDYDFFDKETRIEKEPDITSTLLITGLPKIPDEKTAKLKNVIKKKFKSFGKISTEDITIFREENTDLSTGSCIIKFRSSGDAHAALALKKFDKNHSLQSVCVQDCLDTDTRLQKMTKTLSVLKESDALFSHNNDIRQRCQFLVRCGAKTTVCWHDPLRLSLEGRDPFVDYDENKGEAATELILPTEEITITAVRWSKTGKFLGAIGSKGQIVVYGGSPLKKLCEFGQKFCDFEFSPMDNFVVAIKTEDPQARSRQSRAIVVTRVAEVWDFLLVKLTVVVSLKTGLRLKWSFDEKYFAFMTNSGISIYETETTSLVGGETLQIPRVANFEWCPASSFLAFRCDPDNERRVKLGTLAVPSLQQRIASIYHGNPRLRISWDCDRLVSDVHTYTHKNRPKHVSFDFFDYKQSFGAKNAHFALTEKILHILKAGRTEEFPIVLHSSFSPMKPLLAAVYVFKNQYHVSVFDLKKDEEIVHLQREKVNRVLWSPCGLRLVAVGLSSGGDACNGGLVFVDCETRLVIKKQSHFNCNSADWSPFGRFLMTAILDKSGLVDNRTAQRSYNIYDSAGELVVSQNSSQLKQFLWRPRPKLKESAEPNSEKRQELEELDESVRLLNVSEEERLRGNRLTNYRNAMAGLACSLEEERKLIEKLRKDLIVVSLEEEVEIEKDVRVEVERFVEEMDQ